MQEQIGITAGVIWQALSTKGELSLAKLNREVKSNAPIFDWAIGWLAREDSLWRTGVYSMRLVTHLPPRPPRATVPVPQDIHPADRV